MCNVALGLGEYLPLKYYIFEVILLYKFRFHLQPDVVLVKKIKFTFGVYKTDTFKSYK